MRKGYFNSLARDPIEELIGKQLASLSFDGIYTFKKSRHQISQSSTSRVVSTNSIEDMFLEAIDKKYFKKERKNEVVLSMLEDGFSVDNISEQLSISIRTLRRMCEEMGETDGED